MVKSIVFIGFAEAHSAPEVLWSLIDQGFEVVAFTRKGRKPALRHSRFVKLVEISAPELNALQAERDLASAISNLSSTGEVRIGVMPLDDLALWLCGRPGTLGRARLVGPEGAALDLALDKRKQLSLAQQAGFVVPPFRCVDQPEEIAEDQVKFPLVFKPALACRQMNGGLSRGHGWTCADGAELQSAIRKWEGKEPMILQEFVHGVGEGIFGLATDNGIVGWSGHRRVRMMNPQGSGSSACRSVFPIDEKIKVCTERFLKGSNWRGLFMIELLRDTSGTPLFIEFNGRAWGSMALARRLGLEYPAWSVQMALDSAVSPAIAQQLMSNLMCRHLGREILHLLFVMRGSSSKALVDWPSVWTTLGQVCRIGRNDRWYNWRRDDPKVFWSDCFGTLRNQFAWAKTKR